MESIVKVSDFDYDSIPQNIDEMFIERMKIQRELSLDCQIDPNSFENTLRNLYHYYLDLYPFSDLPDIFYEDFIEFSAEKLFSRNRFIPCLEELDSKQNKK
jgi:hypothetical protein